MLVSVGLIRTLLDVSSLSIIRDLVGFQGQAKVQARPATTPAGWRLHEDGGVTAHFPDVILPMRDP